MATSPRARSSGSRSRNNAHKSSRKEELDNRQLHSRRIYRKSAILFLNLKRVINDLRAGDLVNLKVGHDFEDMEAGEARIVTQILNGKGKDVFMNCLILRCLMPK